MDDHKSYTQNCPLDTNFEPKMVYIPLHQHIGAPCTPTVKVGDEVKVGQKIGESKATISAPVHSSVSGKVMKIEQMVLSNGQKGEVVVIESDGLNELGYTETNDDFTQLSKEVILERIKEAGIVGLGGAGFPTHIKMKKKPDVKIEEVILNGAECEPYLTSDQLNMELYPQKAIGGLKIIMKLMDCDKGYIGVEDNKQKAIGILKNAAKDETNISICAVKTKYPQGDERRLINAITGKKISKAQRSNERGVQGLAIKEPKNVYVPIGTKFKDLVDYCDGFKETPYKIVVGGPMMGACQYNLDAPTVKTTGGIIFMNEKDATLASPEPCIKCAKCVDVCPIGLLPLFLQLKSLNGDFEGAEKMHLNDCIECGTCSYVCPSNRPLVEAIVHAKTQLKAQQRKRG